MAGRSKKADRKRAFKFGELLIHEVLGLSNFKKLLSVRIEEMTSLVIGLCINIHSKLGPGCFEKVYEEILYYELNKLGRKAERQILLFIQWESLNIKNAYKIDMIVEDILVLEIKSIYPLAPVFFNQIRTIYHFSILNMVYY